jgi:hypothetical protein
VSAELVALDGTVTTVTPLYKIDNPNAAEVVIGKVTAGTTEANTFLVATYTDSNNIDYTARIPLVITKVVSSTINSQLKELVSLQITPDILLVRPGEESTVSAALVALDGTKTTVTATYSVINSAAATVTGNKVTALNIETDTFLKATYRRDNGITYTDSIPLLVTKDVSSTIGNELRELITLQITPGVLLMHPGDEIPISAKTVALDGTETEVQPTYTFSDGTKATLKNSAASTEVVAGTDEATIFLEATVQQNGVSYTARIPVVINKDVAKEIKKEL